jgi:hypothetical protein
VFLAAHELFGTISRSIAPSVHRVRHGREAGGSQPRDSAASVV